MLGPKVEYTEIEMKVRFAKLFIGTEKLENN
jgi:hypothetical protein